MQYEYKMTESEALSLAQTVILIHSGYFYGTVDITPQAIFTAVTVAHAHRGNIAIIQECCKHSTMAILTVP